MPELALDARCDAALLVLVVLGGDAEAMVGRRIVVAMAGIGKHALEGFAGQRGDLGNHGAARVVVPQTSTEPLPDTVIIMRGSGIARQRLDVADELAALRALHRGRHTHLWSSPLS